MTELPRSCRWESITRGIQGSSIVNETTGGARYGNDLFERRSFPAVIFEYPEDLAPQYEAMVEAIKRRVRAFYFTLDGSFDNVKHIRLDDDRMEPELAFAGEYAGRMQQWFRWTMRASVEVVPVEVE